VDNIMGDKKYQFNDANASKGTNYYRIVVNDKDGKTSYSKIAAVNLSMNQRISLFPNPANSEIGLSGIEKGATVQMTDITGKLILQQIANSNIQIINISNLSKGLYSIKTISPNGELNTQTFFKQ
ncbi:MAG: T9SS type A sorting domain-containing protein, partial [Dolichospermum sp.]